MTGICVFFHRFVIDYHKGRYVFSGGRAGASGGRVISESEHQNGRAIPHVSYSRLSFSVHLL